ncbi:MAG TPA: hypothetical protein VI911_07595 [Patescibacteria group bacterium]|nr:hypothetical protein [Patescibacteria group bacterium]
MEELIEGLSKIAAAIILGIVYMSFFIYIFGRIERMIDKNFDKYIAYKKEALPTCFIGDDQ